MSVLDELRQLRYPAEFRIESTEPWTGAESLLKELGSASRGGAASDELPEPQRRLLVEIGTGLWRLRQKMLKPGSSQPLDEMRKPYRHLESVWDALTQAGVEIHDYSDRPFDQGLSLKVIAYQPTPGLTRQRIVETVKPSVYLRGDMLQIGEVIVGTPEGTH